MGENGIFVHNGCGDNQSVYALYDENTNQIEYVGRTNDLEKEKRNIKQVILREKFKNGTYC